MNMAPSSSSSPSKSPVPSLHQSFHFTPIPECEEDSLHEERCKNIATPSSDGGSSATPSRHRRSHHHTPTPLHNHQNGKSTGRKRYDNASSGDGDGGGVAVSCNKCRPHHPHREKFSVVPLENQNPSFISSPNVIIKSIFQSLTRKSPKPAAAIRPLPPQLPPSSSTASREEQWRLAVAELSHKLIQATKKKEEAVLEASRLKSSMAELEKKLTKLEIYCHNLKSGLDECSSQKQSIRIRQEDGFNGHIIQQFLVSVSESRSSIRALSRSLASQLRTVGGKVYERLSHLLQPFDVKINSFAKSPKSFVFYLEALLTRAFFEDFEASGFQKSGSTRILNPIDRCESNYASFNVLMGLTWDEVLSRGTKHFSEEFSRFCDRKQAPNLVFKSLIALSPELSMLSWNRAWPGPLLQAFFVASKSVWLVHLLANSVNPGLQIFRVEKGVRFDPVYMEEIGGDRVRGLVRDSVRVMVQPGFYVYGSVVKCKVVCKHCMDDDNDRTAMECGNDDKILGSPLGV
ncbi:PREDICTED: LOW QUALITY PROTEIN: IRK-interacting protein [Tarenaya hassleriana]|uniref:LOW QUALITY PROTEIN: IRK-interacting protein n=1 Tax=Tarenaya hassleriana TaxID=28532 RepID=UPI00053C5EED|nr:PREDICTED: LOW QUALITY PROTEIN: IRK-interacting protein [Tarenaya hassleriana]